MEAIIEDETGAGLFGASALVGQIATAPAALVLVGVCVLIGDIVVQPVGHVFLVVILLAYLAAFVGLFATLVWLPLRLRGGASFSVSLLLARNERETLG